MADERNPAHTDWTVLFASAEYGDHKYRNVEPTEPGHPLRIDRLLPKSELPQHVGHVVFVLTEFQIADKQTAMRNESGASSHEAYKARQHERVRMRLFRDKDDPLPPD